MKDYVRIKFRDSIAASDPAYIARALREGEEELQQMEYYHEMARLKQGHPAVETARQEPLHRPAVQSIAAAPQSVGEETAVVVLMELGPEGANKEILGEILVDAGTTVAEARMIILEELAEVLELPDELEILSSRGIRILPKQEHRRRVMAHCCSTQDRGGGGQFAPQLVLRRRLS